MTWSMRKTFLLLSAVTCTLAAFGVAFGQVQLLPLGVAFLAAAGIVD